MSSSYYYKWILILALSGFRAFDWNHLPGVHVEMGASENYEE